MSGYRRVNYYELCRLCTSNEGTKMNIFREEGRRRQLQTKIQTCLPIQVLEEDSLPKIVCHECVKKLENFIEFRETVVSAEGMLESYFTSLRFSEDFLKEGKVYVKNTEKDRPVTPENEVLKSIEKIAPTTGNQIINNDQQIQQPVVVSNINTSNIQIISGVQARVQQYKCAMQMQPGGMAAAVVEATAETHYSYQQQTSQQVSPQQSNEPQNQINDQQSSTSQIQQVQNQIQNHGQINQQMQSQRQISQQISQPQNQTQVGQQQQQNQSQITQQIQQLQRQQREFEKHRQLQQIEKQVQIATQQEFPIKQEPQTQIVHQNNNIILKSEPDAKQNQQIIQKVQSETPKDENGTQNVQSYTVQATPEVFLNLGFKEAPLVTQTVREETKEFKSEDTISRNSIGQISEFLRIKPGPEPTSLITVNPQVISQNHRNTTCKECGKIFSSINQLNGHNCSVQNLLNETSDNSNNKEDSLQNNSNSFSCDVCGKPFKRKEHLYQHRKLHTGERPYVCTTCSKAFSRKEHLVRHSVSHTGEKMHQCEMCGKNFSRKDNLHKHRKTHGVSGPYICETCGKSFVVKHYYLMHLTTHASTIGDGVNCQDPLPYKCDICHKAFSVKQYLTTHKLRHRSKNNNSSHNTVNGQQQQQQTQQSNTNNINIVTSNVNNSGNLNNSNGQSNNGSTVEMQSVIERNEQPNGSFNNQYHNNIQEFQ
ncbi:zinc finger and SCAN domain-containing protein 2-like [Apis dorsata]|uniref:zinc finger and SCAN domain-containing protein 2-like n=1 Tax=Apis dorsata TaxID=7462 RepID=UPI0003DF4938|nr:zinc finger and SCAN domain-containing protein 2-like [Apis dorsata]